MPAFLIATSGPFKDLTFSFDKGSEWILGHDPISSDFVLDDPKIHKKQLLFQKKEGEIFVTPLEKTPLTQLNGEKIVEETLLKEGDSLLIGDSSFVFSERKSKKRSAKKTSYDDIFEGLASDTEKSLSEETPIPQEKTSKEPSAYDTIFEDVENLPELPFPLSQDTPFLLKVIAGPNSGAEIGLEKGKTYIIGTDSKTSDIIFQDFSVSRSHAKLSIHSDGTLDIEDLGSKNGTTVNGMPIVDQKIVTPQDVIGMGTSLFLIIDREAPQETIYSPILPTVKAPVEEEEKIVSPEEKKIKNWKEEPIPTRYLVIGGSILSVFLVIFFTFFSLFKSEEVSTQEKHPVAHIEEALKKFEDIQFSFNPTSGKLFLVGHVLTTIDYLEMRYQVDTLPFITSVEDNVVIDEGVCKSINEVLSSNMDLKGMSVRAVQPGKFIATGYLQTNAEMAAAQEYLMLNFPYTDRLENKIVSEEALNTKIQTLLYSSGFSAVTFQLTQGSIMLSGVYDSNLQDQYDSLLKELKTMQGITSVQNFALPTSQIPAINISNQYRVSGTSWHDDIGYNVVLNGVIYNRGDSINGMQIIHIEKTSVLLEKDGCKYKIEYTPNYNAGW